MTHFPWKLTRNGSEIYFPEGARRYVSCSIEQIGGDGRLDRFIDGSAVYLGDTAFHRHAITLSCSGHTVAPVFDVWPSQTVTLECPVEFAVAGPSATLAYDPVPGSVYGVDADDNRRAATVSGRSVSSAGSVAIRYRPIMQCIVASRTNDKTQGRADAGWTIRFEDLSGWEDDGDDDSRVSLGAPGLQSYLVGTAVSLNMAPLASTNSGLPITFSLASGSFPPGVSMSSVGLITGTPTMAGSYAAVVAATSGAVSATQTVPYYAPADSFAGPYVTATGGTVRDWTDAAGLNWREHRFTASSNFVVTAGGEVDTRIVSGGGGGGQGIIGGGGEAGAGGGAGGVARLKRTVAVGTHPVVVGAGGAKGSATTGTRGGRRGTASSFLGIAPPGGGGGAGPEVNEPEKVGGSGGGDRQISVGGPGTPYFGNAGGLAAVTQNNVSGGAGGGGGAGGVGGTPVLGAGASGGIGLLDNIRGYDERVAGGGAGTPFVLNYATTSNFTVNSLPPGSGGLGGGGNLGTSGAANTGGGGGGNVLGSNNAGAGGSGEVIVRYRRP